jgi:hypothetical protein
MSNQQIEGWNKSLRRAEKQRRRLKERRIAAVIGIGACLMLGALHGVQNSRINKLENQLRYSRDSEGDVTALRARVNELESLADAQGRLIVEIAALTAEIAARQPNAVPPAEWPKKSEWPKVF